MVRKRPNRFKDAASIPIVLRLFARDYKVDMFWSDDLKLCDEATQRIRELIAEENAVTESQGDSLSEVV